MKLIVQYLYAVLNTQRKKRFFRGQLQTKKTENMGCLGFLVNGLCIYFSEYSIWISVKWISIRSQCFSAYNCCPKQSKMMKDTGHQLLNGTIFIQNRVWGNNWKIVFFLYNHSLPSQRLQHFSGEDILCCQDLELIGNLSCVAGEQLGIL